MNEDFSLSIGMRGTICGYEAVAAYSRQHGVNCFQGHLSINNGNANGLINHIDEDLSKKLGKVLPDFLKNINADIKFSFGYDHNLFSVDTGALKFTAIGLKSADGSPLGSGFLCAVSESGEKGDIFKLIKDAKDLIGIDDFYLYISNGKQPVDIGRLLQPFNKKDTIETPAIVGKGGFCLYSQYSFSKGRCGLLDVFLGKLLGVKSLSFFAGNNSSGAYFVLSLPRQCNDILSVENMLFEFVRSKTGLGLIASGKLSLNAIPQISFGVNCTLSNDSVMLSAAVLSKEYVKLIGDFYLGEAVLTIGYDYKEGFKFGILGDIQLRKLYLFGAVQLAYNSVLNIQLISFATGKITLSELVESITGIYISGLDLLDSILCIEYFDFSFKNNFEIEWFKNDDIAQIVKFFKENVSSNQLWLDEEYVSIKAEPNGYISAENGYYLVDKFRMRHYYVKNDGSLHLCPQFYYSNVANPYKLPNGMLVSAGIFLCAQIRVFGISLKILFSFRQSEGVLAFGRLSEINLGIIKISSSEFSQDNPIPIPETSVLWQFLGPWSKGGVAFYFQASANEVSFYFDGMISIAGSLLKCQSQLFYQKGLVIFNAESVLCGVTTRVSLKAKYESFIDSSFSFVFSFDTYGLEEKLQDVQKRLNQAIEKCREKIQNAYRELEDAKCKVRKLYGEIDVLNQRINQCRIRLSQMSWFKKVFYAPVIACEIASFEIAKGIIYASIFIAEAALSVAQAAVKFGGCIGTGVLQLINGVITAATSLFFIRKLEAALSANVNEMNMQLSIEFVALGKEYSHSWHVKKSIMKDKSKGQEVLSNEMLKKIEPDVIDLENGVVSSKALMEQYADFEGYFVQEAKISDAAAVLKRNTQITQFIQNAYIDEFGEALPEFNEINEQLLDNLDTIKANIDIFERAAALSDANQIADKLKDIQLEANDGDSEYIAEALENYNKATELHNELIKLLDQTKVSQKNIRSFKTESRKNVHDTMHMRGINGEQYRNSVYEYAKSVRERIEFIYQNLSDDGYTNPYKDEQIWNMILQAEEYFKTNS